MARRELLRNRVPDVPGGGTVAYVNPTEHRYLDDPVHREEGGTPAIIESIRAGLVFQLKQAVGIEVIRAHEDAYLRRAVEAWRHEPGIQILGNLDSERLSIVSFVVKAPSGRYLHHNFVVALLNDLFGIQSRGGCSCAGPYGHTPARHRPGQVARVRRGDRARLRGHQAGLGPGELQLLHLRGGLPYVVEAVRLVAQHGWRLLGRLPLRPVQRALEAPPRPGGTTDAAVPGRLRRGRQASATRTTTTRRRSPRCEGYLAEARELLSACHHAAPTVRPASTQDFDHLRWFDLPSSCLSPVVP